MVPLVFFHFCRKWTTTRDDICTNDNRGVVALGEQCCAGMLPLLMLKQQRLYLMCSR